MQLLGTQGGAQNLLSRLGMPGTALQQQGLGVFQNLLAQPTAQQRVFDQVLPALQGQLTGVPGMDVLGAAQPIFQRNLGEALARQREVGPRFASAGQREARTLEQQGLQDFNLYSQQVLESGRARQLQAALAAGQLGAGADASILANLSGANQFAAGAQAPQLQLLAQLLPELFKGGLSQGVITGPSPFSQALGGLAGLASIPVGMGWQPFARRTG